MKAFKAVSLLSGLAGLVVSGAAISGPGQGWDVFNMGVGERIPHAQPASAATGGVPGKGWDVMRTGAGEPLPVYDRNHAFAPTSASAGLGWDVFYTGEGDPLPGRERL